MGAGKPFFMQLGSAQILCRTLYFYSAINTIAEEVAELLLTFPNKIIPLIKAVLTTNDDIWKYWCLIILVKRLPEDIRMQFKSDLIRLVESPTVGEKLEELDEIALEILQMIE